MTRYATGQIRARGRRPVRQLVVLTTLAVVASLLTMLGTQSPAAAEEPPSGYVSCGYGLVCNGAAPVTGDIAPIVVTGLDPWNRIVQKPAAAPLYSLEAEATAMVAALHGVPNDRRVTLWARGEIRAMMFARLLQAIDKPGNQRTSQEQAWIDNVTTLLRQRRVTMAQNAISEYNKWYADPCTYKPPFTYTTPPILPQCALAGGGQLTTIAGTSWDSPPTFGQFQTYGAALLSNAEFGTTDAIAAVNDSTAALAFFAGAAAAATLSLITAITAGSVAAVATAVGAAIGSGVAATAAMTGASTLGALAASLGTPVIAVGAVAGSVAVAVLGIVMIAVHSWQIDTALKLPTKLAQAKLDAQSDPIDLHQVVHDDCGDAPDGCGRLEVYSTLLAQTLPDFSAQRDAAETPPTRRASDPKFELYDEAGRSLGKVDSISPQGGNNLSMSDGWFITNDFVHPAKYALESKYVDWNGTPSIVSIHGEKFTTRAQIGSNNTPANVSAPGDCFDLLIAGAKRRACWTGNRPPLIAPTMTENPVEGSPVTFRANATDPDGDALTYNWSIEDPQGNISFCADYRGNFGSCPWSSAATPEVTVTYPNQGLQHAKLTVTDAAGASTTQTFAFQVANAAPVVTLDPPSPSTVEAGGTVTLTGTVTDQGRDTVTLTVDWGDGTTSTSSVNPCNLAPPQICIDNPSFGSPPLGTKTFEFTHTYTTDPQGTDNTVQAKVTAYDGVDKGSATTPVTITPGPFRVFVSFAEGFLQPGDRRTTTEGQDGEPIQLSGWIDLEGPFTLDVSWGDGYSTSYTGPCLLPGCALNDQKPAGLPFLVCNGPCRGQFFHLDHYYADGPSHPLMTVKVTDDDGRVITAGATATITNVAPTVRFDDGGGSTGSALVGRPYSLEAGFSDPGEDTFVSSIDWGDGSLPTECDDWDCLWPTINEQHTFIAPGQYDVTVTVTDDDGGTGQIVRTVDVEQPVNTPPTVEGTSATTVEDTAVTVTPLGDDADGDGLVYSVTQPSHGTALVTASGLEYTPDPDYNGTDSFTYAAYDGAAVSDYATVDITVNSVPDALEADDTHVDTDEDEPVVVDPVATSVDGPVTFSLLTSPAHGTLQGATAPWTYVPDADFHGSDTFDYAVKSGAQVLARTAYITVNPVNDAPTAQDASRVTTEDKALTFTPQSGDVDGDALTLSIVDGPAHGTAEVTASGQLRYVPDANYHGSDSFSYRASDGSLSSPKATVSITVTSVNDLPSVDAVASFSATYSDAITPVTVDASDVETPKSSLVFSATGLPAGLTMSSTGTLSGTVTGTPAAYPTSVEVCDADQGCTTIDFTITVQPETAVVRLTPSNPHAVATSGSGAPAITFTGRVTDSADGSFGDVGRVVPSTLRFALTPVAGGNTTTCTPSIVRRVAATATAPGYVDVSCTFSAGVKSDVYDVTLAVSGSFTGSDASLLTVYDPKARGTSGAGSVLLPNGNTGEFAFTVAGDKKSVKGKLALLEKTPDGATVSTLKGTALQTLTVGTGSPLPAAFTGKAVVNGIGNYAYVVNVTDAGATGDTFALRLTTPAGAPSLPGLSFTALPLRPGGAVTVR